MKTQLITPQLVEQFLDYPLYSQDGKKGDAVCVCAFYIGNVRWYVLEGQPEGDDFILYAIVVGLSETEYGYVSVHELQQLELDASRYGLGKMHVSMFTDFSMVPLDQIKDVELQDFLTSLYH